jgi:glycine/D-amino acid oxidase-like deaminating enzyme
LVGPFGIVAAYRNGRASVTHLYGALPEGVAGPIGNYWADTAPPAPICQPLRDEQRVDVVIIGAGFTGLSAAYHIRLASDRSVHVLEAGAPGNGASGRNGGFACTGATRFNALELGRRFGIDTARQLFEIESEAVNLVRDIAHREGFSIDETGEGELEIAHSASRVAGLKAEGQFLNDNFGCETRYLSGPELAQNGMNSTLRSGGLLHDIGYGIHPMKYVRGLLGAALGKGALVHGSSPVIGWERSGNVHRLITPGGTLLSDQVIVATNGYTTDGLTPMLAGQREKQGWSTDVMAFDTRTLLHYFRLLPDGRLLFGGRGGTSLAPAKRARVRRNLRRAFERLFPAWRDVEDTHFWQGFLCLARDAVPHIGAIGPGVLAGLAYHGNGIAMSTWTGRALAALAMGEPAPTMPRVMSGPPPRFPLPRLRRHYTRLPYLAYGLRDSLP